MTKITSRGIERRWLLSIAAAAPLTLALPAWAQDNWPTRPIQWVVGFPPGQATDRVARLINEPLGERLGQPVYIDNRPGATGIVAAEYVRRADPDGYTMFFSSGAVLAINPGLYRNLSYDPLADFRPISLIAGSALFLTVDPSLPVRSVQELVDYARAHPGELAYATGGSGSTQHLGMELFKSIAGVDILHVPYQGSPAAITALLSGEVQIVMETAGSVVQHAEAGNMRILAVTADRRAASLPDVPTVAEEGFPGLLVAGWLGLVAPAGTPDHVVERVSREIDEILASDELGELFDRLNLMVLGGTPEAFDNFLRAEIPKWRDLIVATGAQVD